MLTAIPKREIWSQNYEKSHVTNRPQCLGIVVLPGGTVRHARFLIAERFVPDSSFFSLFPLQFQGSSECPIALKVPSLNDKRSQTAGYGEIMKGTDSKPSESDGVIERRRTENCYSKAMWDVAYGTRRLHP